MSEIVLRCIQMAASIFEVWLCYQVAYVTVLDEETMGWKEKVVEWANILGLGMLLGINRSLAFFSYTMLLICVFVTSICIWFICKKKSCFYLKHYITQLFSNVII